VVKLEDVSIINRRNAVLGWATWQAAKRLAEHKARSAVPGGESGRPIKRLVVGALAAGAAVVAFIFLRREETATREETAAPPEETATPE
jgi:hypothetical protein